MDATDTASVKAAIDREIEGQTICDLLERNARDHADLPALSYKADGEWRHITWSEYRQRVAQVALGLKALGVKKGDFVAIMARNRPEHLIADLGIVHAGATPVSLYNTLAPEQIAYIAGHCEAKIAIVESDFCDRWEKVRADLPALQTLIKIEETGSSLPEVESAMTWDRLVEDGRRALVEHPEDFEASHREVGPDDPVTVIYTSGTTGPPKGVVITNYNVLWTACSLNKLLDWPHGMKYVSYLPLAHSAERTATHYVGLWDVAWVHFCPDVLKVFEVVPEVHPDSFVGVPRVWEKLQAGITAGLAAEPDERKRKIALRAIETGREAVRLERAGSRLPLGLKLRRALFDRLVFSKIREKIGLDRSQVTLSGAAPVSEETLEFFNAIGVPVVEIYGMTESVAPAITNRPEDRRIGTVGKPMPGVEIRLLDDGELLMRGGNVTAGYYKDPEKTAETFDEDGWLHTGDIAEIDSDGFVKIVDRKKELIITAGGKNIAPSNVEGLLKQHPLIGQACVIGDRKPYLSALIVLDAEVAPTWASKNGLEFTTIEEFSRSERVRHEIQLAVDSANQHVSRVEGIKRFTILPTEWTADSEELTPTLKLKRRVIHQKYADEIEALYSSA